MRKFQVQLVFETKVSVNDIVLLSAYSRHVSDHGENNPACLVF